MKRFAPLIAIAFVSLITPAFAEINIDVVVDGLNNPWEMVFAPNGDIYFSERDGRVWKIQNFGEAKVIQTFPKSGSYEGGTLGLALHPNFEENKKMRDCTRSFRFPPPHLSISILYIPQYYLLYYTTYFTYIYYNPEMSEKTINQ